MKFLMKCLSSLIGRANYMGFYIDWLIEVISSASGYAIVIMTASIYIGIFLYINGMVCDMKMRMKDLESDFTTKMPRHTTNHIRICSIYVEEIEFHLNIIG